MLDRQIVDITGLKVVRANDVVLRKVGSKFCIVGVGGGSIMRRLGFDITGRLSLFESFLPWEYVEPVDPEVRSLRMKVERTKLSKLHPADIADIMEDLSPKQRILMFNELDENTAAKTLIATETSVSKEMINKFNSKKLVALMGKLDIDEIAEILGNMPKEKAEIIIGKLSPKTKEMVERVMGYPENTAGRIMNPNVISVSQEDTIQKVIERFREIAPKTREFYYFYVIDSSRKLIGLLTIRDLIINSPQTHVSEVVSKRIIKVTTNTDKDEVSKIIVKYRLSAVPVVDEEGVLKGKIALKDILGDTTHKTYLSKPKYAHISKSQNHNPEQQNGPGKKRRPRKRKKE